MNIDSASGHNEQPTVLWEDKALGRLILKVPLSAIRLWLVTRMQTSSMSKIHPYTCFFWSCATCYGGGCGKKEESMLLLGVWYGWVAASQKLSFFLQRPCCHCTSKIHTTQKLRSADRFIIKKLLKQKDVYVLRTYINSMYRGGLPLVSLCYHTSTFYFSSSIFFFFHLPADGEK